MTDLTSLNKLLFGPGFKDMDKFMVGFDEQFNKLAKFHDDVTKHIPNYPPYNIKKTEDNKYVIELAVAGFSRNNIEIELADDRLVVKGFTTDDDKGEYLFKGVADRAFTRQFALSDEVQVKDAEMLNGMLKIFLERIIPEHKKPKKIEVKEKQSAQSKKEFLIENEE